jgi:hypothetical protein
MPAARLALRSSRSPSILALALFATALACRVSVDTEPPGGTRTPEPAPTAELPPADPKIDPARMLADVQYLASDELRGRFTFSDDLAVAADHLTAQYEAIGLGPVGESYRVAFKAPFGSKPGDDLIVWVEDGSGKSRQVSADVLTTVANGNGEAAYAEAVGIKSLAAAKADAVRRKIAIAPAPAPAELAKAIEAFAEHQPAGLVLVSDDDRAIASSLREPLRQLKLPVAWVSTAAAKEWLGIQLPAKTKAKPEVPAGTRLSLSAKREDLERDTFNVLAVLPGTKTPAEIVILGAHYDHIGTTANGVMCREKAGDTICNGADDNASGTAMVLEVARAFADARYRPARTIVFAHFAGEELGLHGSRALASKPPKVPPFEGGKVVAMVNLDMVGRLGETGLAIGGVGSSDAWMPLLDELGSRDMTIVYERAINSRSDHANFYRNKVPVLFFFTGLHDDYHQAGDHFEVINREGMATIGQLVADLTRALGDGADVPYAPPRNDDEGVVSRMPGSDDVSVEKRTGAAAKRP